MNEACSSAGRAGPSRGPRCAASRAGPQLGLADDFTLAPNGSTFADGDIKPDTPDRLEQFLAQNKIPTNADLNLTSRGGNLNAGLEMGRIIRAHRLHTWVGSNTKIAGLYVPTINPPTGFDFDFGTYPGYCVSSCTFAFLGGTKRSIWEGGIYAVHRAAMECRDPDRGQPADKTQQDAGVPPCPSSEQAVAGVQEDFGKLIAYVQEMGVDPGFLTEMAATADPKGLLEDQMKKYKIIYEPGGTEWALKTNVTGEFYLQDTVTTEWKTNYLRFVCRRNPDPKLIIFVIYDPANSGGSEDVQKIINSSQQGLKLTYFRPGRSLPLKWWHFEDSPAIDLGPDELIRYPFRTADGKIGLVFVASPRVLDVLRAYTGFMVSNGLTGKDYVNFGGADYTGRTQLNEFMASCH